MPTSLFEEQSPSCSWLPTRLLSPPAQLSEVQVPVMGGQDVNSPRGAATSRGPSISARSQCGSTKEGLPPVIDGTSRGY